MQKIFNNNDFLYNTNVDFIEKLYQQYKDSPSSLDDSWIKFFRDMENGSPDFKSFDINSYSRVQPKLGGLEHQNFDSNNLNILLDSLNEQRIIRQNSTKLADLDPLGIKKPTSPARFSVDKNSLSDKYCGYIGVEFEHVSSDIEKEWLYEKFESDAFTLPDAKKLQILENLIHIKDFEHFLHVKFPGAKRFSIEGNESSLLAVQEIIASLVKSGTQNIAIAMAHRGRLNTLANIMHKPIRAILSEFMGCSPYPPNFNIQGDVKYHLGYNRNINVKGDIVNLKLLANPSHLESITPILSGVIRSEIDSSDEKNSIGQKMAAGIAIHGDAAFCGQGVVAESLSMSRLDAYKTGGIIHIVVNNQIGFTTDSNDAVGDEGMSTDFAKIIGAPIIHVNSGSPEDVVRASQMAYEYREKFQKDIVLDVIGYRKYGHNEGDEPSYTQNAMYEIIRKSPAISEKFANQLIDNKIIDQNVVADIKNKFRKKMDAELELAGSHQPELDLPDSWKKVTQDYFASNNNKTYSSVNTGLDKSILKSLAKRVNELPSDFNANSKLVKLLSKRIATIESEENIEWALAEQMAFASILSEKISVRICGQDSQRGTFSHRHSIIHNIQPQGPKNYVPLSNISAEQGKFSVYNSNLSEFAALGFEYGYSLRSKEQLVIWEAQFGDFVNGAQIIVDQYITSGFEKWLQMSGLVMLLPHGSEGQGPEHSSARLERFLELCAGGNICVANITTPANFFHILRRQVLSNFVCPLIIMTPKSLLRHPLAVSKLDDFAPDSNFTAVIDEVDEIDASKIKNIIFCSGKVYYDLLELRRDNPANGSAIVRIEQLYPLAKDSIENIMRKYKKVENITWCQEEPKNMGAWNFIRDDLSQIAKTINKDLNVECISRERCSSPAEGSSSLYIKNQKKLLKTALKI